MDAIANVPPILLIIIILCPVVAYYLLHRRPRSRSGRRDPELLNMVFGNKGAYDRLVCYHGTAKQAKEALLKDRRSHR